MKVTTIKYKFEKGWHTFKTDDKSIEYGYIGEYSEAVKNLVKHYHLTDFEIV